MLIPARDRLFAPLALGLLLLAAGAAEAGPTKEYSVQESTRCSYGQGCPRMVRNAMNEAEAFCRTEGGVLTGDQRGDFRCEQRGIYCVVSGRIECVGRFDPTRVPGPPPIPGVPEQPSRRRERTCLDQRCDRFISHAPGPQELGTHACPYGYLLAGVSGIGNNIVCQDFSKPVRKTTVEVENRRSGMLACPAGMVARGVNPERTRLLCARVDAGFGSERVQEEKGNEGIQACLEVGGGSLSTRHLVVGVGGDRDRLLCAPVVPR